MVEARCARQIDAMKKKTPPSHPYRCNSWTFRSISIATPCINQVHKQIGIQVSTFFCVLRIASKPMKLHPSSGTECGCTHNVIADNKILLVGRPCDSSLDALSFVSARCCFEAWEPVPSVSVRCFIDPSHSFFEKIVQSLLGSLFRPLRNTDELLQAHMTFLLCCC